MVGGVMINSSGSRDLGEMAFGRLNRMRQF